MSVLVKGMKMPKDGVYWCEIGVAGEIAMITIHGEDRKSFHLVPVPPHGRLIDADALLKLLDSCMFPSDMVTTRALSMATNWLKEAQTVIPADKDGET